MMNLQENINNYGKKNGTKWQKTFRYSSGYYPKQDPGPC